MRLIKVTVAGQGGWHCTTARWHRERKAAKQSCHALHHSKLLDASVPLYWTKKKNRSWSLTTVKASYTVILVSEKPQECSLMKSCNSLAYSPSVFIQHIHGNRLLLLHPKSVFQLILTHRVRSAVLCKTVQPSNYPGPPTRPLITTDVPMVVWY